VTDRDLNPGNVIREGDEISIAGGQPVRVEGAEGADLLRAELVELLGLPAPYDNPKGIVEEVQAYHRILAEVSKVYDDVTEGRISKPHTHAYCVIDAVNKRIERERDEAIAEAKAEAAEFEQERDEEREKREALAEAAAGADETLAELERLRALERDLKDTCSGVNCMPSFEWKQSSEGWKERCRKAEARVADLEARVEQLEVFEPGMLLPDGREAEELRRGIEKIIDDGVDEVSVGRLQRFLDEVDARDSFHACNLTDQLSKAEEVIEAARTWLNSARGARGPIVRALLETVAAYDKVGGGP